MTKNQFSNKMIDITNDVNRIMDEFNHQKRNF